MLQPEKKGHNLTEERELQCKGGSVNLEILKDFSTTVKVFTKKSFNKKGDLECKEGKVNLEILKDNASAIVMLAFLSLPK